MKTENDLTNDTSQTGLLKTKAVNPLNEDDRSASGVNIMTLLEALYTSIINPAFGPIKPFGFIKFGEKEPRQTDLLYCKQVKLF